MSETEPTVNPDSGSPKTQRDITRCIRQLGSSDILKRTVAEQHLRAMGAEAVDPLLAAVRKEATVRRYWHRFVRVTLALIIVWKVWKFCHQSLGVSDFTILPSILLYFLHAPDAAMRHKRLVHILADIDDRRAIGPLADALEFTRYKDNDAFRVAKASLIRLLPQIHASDLALLTDKQRSLLLRALTGYDKPLTLAILDALEKVGTAQDLPFIQKICSADREVMEAAKQCLRVLSARVEHQKVSQTLLRASAADSAPPEVLLRAAAGKPAEESQLLLRADANDSGELQ